MVSPISTATFGRTGLPVTRMGFGSVFIGMPDIPEQQAIATVRHPLDRGITSFDTAPHYGVGLSERRFSAAFAGVDRDSYILATKVGKLTLDYSRDGALRSIEESLKRLQTDRIDIVHIHDPDDQERGSLDEIFSALAELRSQGVIRAIGAGMNQWGMLARFARQADFDCFLLAGRYTLLEQRPLDKFLPLCAERNIGVFLGGVFNSGILATAARPGASYQYQPASPEILERVGRIEAICERHGVPLQTAALQSAAGPGSAADPDRWGWRATDPACGRPPRRHLARRRRRGHPHAQDRADRSVRTRLWPRPPETIAKSTSVSIRVRAYARVATDACWRLNRPGGTRPRGPAGHEAALRRRGLLRGGA